MKRIFTLLILFGPLLCSAQSMSGNGDFDPRLSDVFEQEYLESLAIKNSFLLDYYNLYLDEGWEIQEFPDGKLGEMQVVDFSTSDLENPNIYSLIDKYKLKRSQMAHKYYRIGKTNHVLVLFSENHFAKIFNQVTGRTKK